MQPLVFLGLFVGLFLSLITVTIVFGQAPPDPDSLEIFHSRGYLDLLETGDSLILVEYKIGYSTFPEESARSAFLIRLMNGTTELGSANPHVRDVTELGNKGYERSVAAFYFDAGTSLSRGIVLGDGSLLTTMTVVIEGSPVTFPDPPSTSNGVGTTLGLGSDKTLLRNRIKTISQSLEEDWGERVLLGTGTGFVLSSTGEDYFATVVPRLIDILPDIFPNAAQSPVFREETYDQAYAAERETFLDGTPIKDLATSFSNWTTIPTDLVLTIIWMLPMGWLTIVAIDKTDKPAIGIPIGVVLLGVGAFAGFVPMQLAIGLAALLAAGVIVMQIMKRHSG